jgi:hypothetical protein
MDDLSHIVASIVKIRTADRNFRLALSTTLPYLKNGSAHFDEHYAHTFPNTVIIV